ncbi:hypothetical protein NKR23_g11492 [Pleurostoma richardsiae]|uniref:SnoaL-like domain-containing protein n=1 Tax=Pleurostoma richardsiae TaxID=41990 RepID=A0AA38R3G6_9PEZI|nr:hypothetical protein NKR23_g11492 [Pleurostoma richardsiae]
MASAYSVTDYLLDKANIHDTVTKMPWYYDVKSEDGLTDEVYAPEVVIDYSKILGAEPYRMTGREWASLVQKLIQGFDSTQHVYGPLIIELPQPGSAPRPDKAKVLSQGNGHMVKKDARGGPLIQNGGRAIFELVRLPELEAKGQNPWRISYQTVIVAWEKGNWAVMTPE